jgi:3-oxoacyl-[acyl-carrier protein] reductase
MQIGFTGKRAVVCGGSRGIGCSIALGYARDGIRAEAVAPGSMKFLSGVSDRRSKEALELYNRVFRTIPFGRIGTPEEVANVVLLVALQLANWVTRQCIAVDGGQLLAA